MGLFDDDRLSQVLTLLQKRHEATLEYLAEKTNNSTRTIRNDIKELSRLLANAAIIESIQGAYRLYITDDDSFQKILMELKEAAGYFNSPRARSGHILETLMKADSPCLIDDLAFEMNIGRTTLNSDIKKLREAMKPYGIGISGKVNSGISLCGPEFGLRVFILENMYQPIYGEYPLDKGIEQSLREISADIGFDPSSEKKLKRYITVMLDRYLNGCKINEMDAKYEELVKTDSFGIASAVADGIENELKITIPRKERIFLALPVVGMRLPTNYETVKKAVIPSHTAEILSKIRARIKLEMDISLDMSNINKEFLYHITFMINRLLYGIQLNNPILSDIKEKYPLAYKMALIAARVVEREYDVKVSSDEVGYLATYFSIYIIENDIKSKMAYSIGIISGTGWVTAKLMEAQLKNIFSSETAFSVISESEVTEEAINSYDLVFSTLKVPFNAKTPVIQTPEIFDEMKLLSLVERVKYLHKLDIPLQMSYNSIIAGLLNEKGFFLLNSKKSFMENTFDMIEKLEAQGMVDEAFKERIAYREAMNTMAFDKYVAFPHAINKGSGRIVLGIGVSETPIKEKDREIRLVFLLGVPETEDKNDMLLVRIYDELIAIANHEEAISELSRSESYGDLIRRFIKISAIFN